MEFKSSMPGIFSMLMDLAKSKEGEDEVEVFEEMIEQIGESDNSDDEDENDLDIILEENILEEKIKDLTIEKNEVRDDFDEIIGLPKHEDSIYDEQLKIIENALECNRKLRKMLQALECELLLFKREIESSDTHSAPKNVSDQLQSLEFYGSFCAPYFKCQGFSCNVNSDQIMKERIKLKLYEESEVPASWEEDELNILKQSIRDMIVQHYFSTLENKGSGLRGVKDSGHKVMVINEVSFIRTADLADVLKKYNDNILDWDKISTNFESPHSGRDCKLMWDLFLKPSIRKDKWTRKEEAALLKAADALGYQNWDKIAEDIGSNRTGYQCFCHYKQHLNKTSKKWSQEDIVHFHSVLRMAKSGEFINWTRIKYFIDDSDFLTLYNKWYKTKCFSSEEARKGKFQPKEDKFIISAVKYGIPLQYIHHYLPSRNSCQIRERYINHLGVKDRKYGIWTSEEDTQLLKLIKEHGEGQWAKIATYFTSRSRTQIRQRYKYLKKIIMQNPDVDLEKIKRRKNNYEKRPYEKNGRNNRKESYKDLKGLSSEMDFIRDKEDLELIKHFVYKKSVFRKRKSVGNNLISNSEQILNMCQLLNFKLSHEQVKSFEIGGYRKHLHDFIFGTLEFVQKNKGLLVTSKREWGNSFQPLPPNIVTVNSLRNILSRLELDKTVSNTTKQPHVEDITIKTKGYSSQIAVENWCRRLFILFSSSYLLSDLDTDWYRKELENNAGV